MFTGIVTEVGTIDSLSERSCLGLRIVSAGRITERTAIGSSVACSGICLTVVDFGLGWFVVEVSGETVSRTTIETWDEGTRINLEHSLCVGDELGGHIVSGHIDTTVTVRSVAEVAENLDLKIELPRGLEKFIAPKGSVALDGVSLTVNNVDQRCFSVNIIPHTRKFTTLGAVRTGTRLNLEIDMLARYIARIHDMAN